MQIDQQDINTYQSLGVVFLKNVVSKYWIEKLQLGVEKNFSNPSKHKCIYEKYNNKELFYDDYCNWNRIIEYKDFLFNSQIATIASQLMKSKKDFGMVI